MNEKKLKDLLNKLDVNAPNAQIIRQILAQFTAIKQTKLVIKALIEQYKIEQLYNEIVENSTDND